jgi:TolB-like protein
MSADPENEYFSDGITDDIIALLSKISVLKVISRTSSMQYKKTAKKDHHHRQGARRGTLLLESTYLLFFEGPLLG